MTPCNEGLRCTLLDIFFVNPVRVSMNFVIVIYPIMESILRLLLLLLVPNTGVHVFYKGVDILAELVFH